MEKKFENVLRKCDPCRCSSKSKPSQYFYTEQIPPANMFHRSLKDILKNRTDDGEQRVRPRPSSANSVKSSGNNKKSIINSSKLASSDSKIMKKCCITTTRITPKTKRENGTKIGSENANELKKDLETIKQQLLLLTERKNEALDVTNELEVRYINLKEKCENQEKEVRELKQNNKKLLKKIKEKEASGGSALQDRMRELEEYEETLSTLYNECLDASNVMEKNKQKICSCIKKKESEFQNMAKSKEELCKAIQEKGNQYEHLRKHCKQCQDQNVQLTQTVEELESQLKKVSKELQRSHQEMLGSATLHQEAAQEREKCHCREMEMKNQEIDELNSTIQNLKTRGCACKHKSSNSNLQQKYNQLEHKYKDTAEKLTMCQQECQKRCEELQYAQNRGNALNQQVEQLQCCCQQLTNMTNENSEALGSLSAANREKDAIIESQKRALAAKKKQVELLNKNEERLNQKVVELQEDLVTMKISCHSSKTKNDGTTVLCSEGCSIRLSEELEDLINALYEEIDKTLAKDAQIQKQYQRICCLQCALASKEKELNSIRNELKNIQERLVATLKEKQTLACHLKALTCSSCE